MNFITDTPIILWSNIFTEGICFSPSYQLAKKIRKDEKKYNLLALAALPAEMINSIILIARSCIAPTGWVIFHTKNFWKKTHSENYKILGMIIFCAAWVETGILFVTPLIIAIQAIVQVGHLLRSIAVTCVGISHSQEPIFTQLCGLPLKTPHYYEHANVQIAYIAACLLNGREKGVDGIKAYQGLTTMIHNGNFDLLDPFLKNTSEFHSLNGSPEIATYKEILKHPVLRSNWLLFIEQLINVFPKNNAQIYKDNFLIFCNKITNWTDFLSQFIAIKQKVTVLNKSSKNPTNEQTKLWIVQIAAYLLNGRQNDIGEIKAYSGLITMICSGNFDQLDHFLHNTYEFHSLNGRPEIASYKVILQHPVLKSNWLLFIEELTNFFPKDSTQLYKNNFLNLCNKITNWTDFLTQFIAIRHKVIEGFASS